MTSEARIYVVSWMGFTDYIQATSAAKAKRHVIGWAQSAGYWKRGKSLTGLTCRVVRDVPSLALVTVLR